MIDITRKEDCCGCGACAQACPKKCITMQPDGEGFLYPVVDSRLCVECGICESTCPILKKAKPAQSETDAYAAYTKDENIRGKSSSGGVFSVLARQVLVRGGVVFGAAFADDFSVHHVKAERVEDLEKLRGSKYVQSRIENTYRETKCLLETGKCVLFTGVSCQIAGLKAFLGKEYEELYTVDVLCHGVPSPAVWQRYCGEQEKAHRDKLSGVSFRDKVTGWKTCSVAMGFKGGARYCVRNSKDPYMKMFLGDICLRPSCHSCRFKDIPRLSDLTIGDAWGIQKHMPDMDDDRGTSVVLVNSEKGRRLWEEVNNNIISRRGELYVLLSPDADSRKSVRRHPNRKRFFEALERGESLEQLQKLARKPGLRRLLSFGKRQIKRLLRK